MAEFPNDQARASYLAALRDERAGLNAELTAARAAKDTARVAVIAARVAGIDDEIDRVTGIDQAHAESSQEETPPADAKKDAATAKKDGGA